MSRYEITLRERSTILNRDSASTINLAIECADEMLSEAEDAVATILAPNGITIPRDEVGCCECGRIFAASDDFSEWIDATHWELTCRGECSEKAAPRWRTGNPFEPIDLVQVAKSVLGVRP